MTLTNRPVGVVILAVLNLIGGLIGTIYSIVAIPLGSLAVLGGAVSGDPNVTGSSAMFVTTTFITLVVSALAVVISLGLFALQKWAWTATYLVQIVNVINNVLRLFQAINPIGAILNAAIAAAVLYYLNQPNVKAAFAIATSEADLPD